MILLLLPIFLLIIPSVHWLDTTALACAACSLGIAHPPGEITHTFLGNLFSLLPIGDCSFRVALFSAVSMVMAVYFLFRWLKLKERSVWVCILCALPFYSHPLELQSVRTEVYGLSALVFTLILFLSTKRDDKRVQILSWFLWGIGMWNHPIIGLASLPWLTFHWSVIWGFTLTLPMVAYLPIRASAGAPWNFGLEPTISGLWWFIRAELYRNYELPTFSIYLDTAQGIMLMFFQIFTPIGILLAILGGFKLYRSKKKDLVPLFLTMLISFFPIITRTNFSSTNPDIIGYMLPAILLTLYLAVEGMSYTFLLSPKLFRAVFCILFISLLTALIHFHDFKNDFGGRLHLRQLESEPKTLAQLNLSSFHTLSFFKYGQIIEGLRPDVTLFYRGLPKEKQGFQRQEYKGEFERPLYWELAMEKGKNGKYSLKSDDLRQAVSLVPTGWFNEVAERSGGSPSDSSYIRQIEEVIYETPVQNRPLLEPLLFNLMNHYLLALHQTGSAKRADVMKKGIISTFPGFNEFDELE